MVTPNYYFIFSKQNIQRLFTENMMNFYQPVFLEKNFLENIRKKVGFWDNYPLIFTLSGQRYDFKNYFETNILSWKKF